MKSVMKKVGAVAAAAVLAFTMTGCKSYTCSNCGKSFKKGKGQVSEVFGIEIAICDDCLKSMGGLG